MSSIIGDAKYQELNMSFTFDQKFEGKLIINALANHTLYQTEMAPQPNFDFEQIKGALLAKSFNMVSISPEILKLKVVFLTLEFQKVEKVTLETLKYTISDLSNKLKQQCQKNTRLENGIKELRTEFDLVTTKIADLSRVNQESKQQLIETMMKITENNKKQWSQVSRAQLKKTVDLEEKLLKLKMEKQVQEKDHKNQLKILRHEFNQKLEQLQAKKMDKNEHDRLQKVNEEEKRKNVNENKLNIHQQRLRKLQDKMASDAENERLRKLEDKVKNLTELQRKILKLDGDYSELKGEISKSEKEQVKKRWDLREWAKEEAIMFKDLSRRVNDLQNKSEVKSKNQLNHVNINPNYAFSSTQKQKDIVIQDYNTKAIMSGGWFGSWRGLALVDGVVHNHSSIKFKILSIGRLVDVGLGIRNLIANNQYDNKNWEQIGHGCFLLNSEGYSFSHSDKEHNYVKADFPLNKQDIINVMVNGDELCFVNETQGKEHKMKIKLTAEEWKQACFCVFLYSYNNITSIEIMK